MSTRVKARVTEAEYLATMTGEKPALEFVDGEVFQKPMTKRDHNDIALRLFAALQEYRKFRPGSYVTWEATTFLGAESGTRYRVPDLAFWDTGRDVSRADDIYLPPTVAIEIRSAGQSLEQLRAKCLEYRRNGVDVCWLIDPMTRSVSTYEGAIEGAPAELALETESLPGLRIELTTIFGEAD